MVKRASPLVRRTITIEEAGAQLGISRNAAYAAARRGEIPTISMGRRKLVPIAALNAMLDPAAFEKRGDV